MKRLLAIACLLPGLAGAQSNLNFQDGAERQVPPGWLVIDGVKGAGFVAEWRQQSCRNDAHCATLAAPASPPPQSFGTLMQSFDATAYRGKTVSLRAWVRLDRKAPTDHAQMLMHVARPNFQEGFADNMADRPIVSGEWQRYEIRGMVSPDATTINIGLTLYGLGRAWISEVEFGNFAQETSGPLVDAARDSIAKQYSRMDSAFLRGDTKEIAAVLMPDAQMRVGTIREPLLPAIEGEIAKGSKLTAKTEVATVKLDGDEAIAVVRREAKDPQAPTKRSVVTSRRDTWIQTANAWRLRESVEVSYHWVLAPANPESLRPVMLELKTRAVPITDNSDLAAFGIAVGDARLVALGEAARGTREFQQLKQRLVEYLAKSKGFTVIAAAAEADVHDLAERFHLEFAPLEAATDLAKIANVTHPQAKIVVWTDNARARDESLRRQFGRKLYVVGFGFRRGDLRAVGVDGGESRGLNTYTAPPSPEGSGDAVLSSVGAPQFFLNMAAASAGSPLARWLADFHLFHDLGAYWVIDDVDASMPPVELSKNYDGLFFVEEVHIGG